MGTNVTINALELASNLAHEKLMDYYENLQDNRDFEFPNGIFEEEQANITVYTEEAQDFFNEYYDMYLTMIEETKI